MKQSFGMASTSSYSRESFATLGMKKGKSSAVKPDKRLSMARGPSTDNHQPSHKTV